MSRSRKRGSIHKPYRTIRQDIHLHQTWCEQGMTHYQHGEMQKAVACFDRIPPSSPYHSVALCNLGGLALLTGDTARAILYLKKILAREPNSVPALNNLGVAMKNLGHWEESESYYRQALAIDPSHLGTRGNLAKLLLTTHRYQECLEACLQLLGDDPTQLETWNDKGLAHMALGQYEQAEATFLNVLTMKPDHVNALINLGNARREMKRLDEAATCYRLALKIEPNKADAFNNLGVVFKNAGRLKDAEICYRHALMLRPDMVAALDNLSQLMLDHGRMEEAETSCLEAIRLEPDNVKLLSNLLFMKNYQINHTGIRSRMEAALFGAKVAKRVEPFVHQPEPSAIGRPLRIGLVSGDLRAHPVSYFLLSVLANIHDKNLKLYAYSNHAEEDDTTRQLKKHFFVWRNVHRLADDRLAECIKNDGIDILMDLSGHTAYNRLTMFARKPAPVQVSWLGYFASTGITAMDYILGDRFVTPDKEKDHFVEKIWRMPGCYLCFTPPEPTVEVGPLPALHNGWITFGCFNNTTKINDSVVRCFARILDRVPHGRLFLKNSKLADPAMRLEMIQRLSRFGIPEHRVLLEGPSLRKEYFAAYNRVDIALDPFPYPGCTTTVEGLWMGVPCVGMRGNRFLPHQSETLLTHAGMADWVAADQEDYINKAIHHARDLTRLSSLRQGLRHRVLQSPLFDATRFAKDLVRSWQGMWKVWCTSNQESMRKVG